MRLLIVLAVILLVVAPVRTGMCPYSTTIKCGWFGWSRCSMTRYVHCVHGQWSEFKITRYNTLCSKSCGSGTRTVTKTRTCTDPPPSLGGKDCPGVSNYKETDDCNTQPCPKKPAA